MVRSSSIFLYLCIFILVSFLGCRGPSPDAYIASRTPDVVAKGAHLVKGLAACGFCHGLTASPVALLSGGRDVVDLYGSVESSNLTPSKSGIGYFTDDEVVLSIRGIWREHPDKRSPTIHRGFEWMSTGDALAITAYLRSLTPINNPIKGRIVGFAARNSTGLFSAPAKVTGHIADISSNDKLLYGKYLVNHVARCSSCHSLPATLFSSEKYLTGGGTVTSGDSTVKIPGLVGNASSMNMWSEPDIYEFFKAGIRPNKSRVRGDLCPIEFFRDANDQEISSITLYLRSLS